MNYEMIKKQISDAAEEIIREARYSRSGDIFVLGCSTSEVLGLQIGKGSSQEVGSLIIETLIPVVKAHGFHLAVQGCEHINRSLVVERDVMLQNRLEEVNVVPALHAGGACSVAAYEQFNQPVMVEHITGTLGIDIGDTEIGMHIKHVQRPVRLSVRTVGEARVTALMYRPKLIGGERAQYLK